MHFGHLRDKTVLVKAQKEDVEKQEETELHFNRGPAPVSDFFTPKGWNLVFLFLFLLCFHWTLDVSLKPL